MYPLAGKVAIITGAGSGIGRAAAIATALEGTPAESLAIVAPDWWAKRARDVVKQTLEAHASGPFLLVSPAVAAASASRCARTNAASTTGIPTAKRERLSLVPLNSMGRACSRRLLAAPTKLSGTF